MTPYFTYNHQKKLYAYYSCTNRNHRGPDACSMANVPAEPLEQVIADRLIQLSQQDRTVDRLVKDAMADTSELLGNLETRRTILCAIDSGCTIRSTPWSRGLRTGERP